MIKTIRILIIQFLFLIERIIIKLIIVKHIFAHNFLYYLLRSASYKCKNWEMKAFKLLKMKFDLDIYLFKPFEVLLAHGLTLRITSKGFMLIHDGFIDIFNVFITILLCLLWLIIIHFFHCYLYLFFFSHKRKIW